MSVEILTAPAVTFESPFPGLRPFEVGESDRFFGREDDIFELLSRLRHMRFLAVVGASGCGKSSLVRAGLIASLAEGALPGRWRVAILRPWQSPVAQLAAALGADVPEDSPGGSARAGGPRRGRRVLDIPANSPGEAAAIVKAILQKGSLGVVEVLRRYPLPPGDNLLILVDQFEELFTFMRDPKIGGAQDEARAFVKLLLEVLCPAKHEDLPVHVALVMRSDFLGDCALFPGLADAINSGLYLLPQMEREQLRDAIKEPVRMYGGKISERLVDTLINDLREDTDQLPVLQHAMMRLWGVWARRGGEKIDFDDYREIGEMSTSLSNHAEEVFGGLDARQRQIAEAVFRSITRVEDGKIVRRQTVLGLIRKSAKLKEAGHGEVEAVINEFRADGRSFLVPPPAHELADDTAVDISHESLIRQWRRLRAWAEDEARGRELHRQIAEAARIWAGKGRDEDYLFGGRRLLEADAWSKNNPGVLSGAEDEFLVASQNAYEKKILGQPKRELSERVVAEGATQVTAIERGAAHVFLAYARADRAFAERLRGAFSEAGEETLVDWDILPSEEFGDYVRAAVEAADTFVYVISPSSAESDLCRRELEHALSRNKRIVPVLLREAEGWRPPEQLRSGHWIRFTERDDFGVAFRTLREAINSDLYWVQAHSRLLVRAAEWEKKGRDASLLLRGRELSDAEQWLGREKSEPALTALQRRYILASRAYATKRQRRLLGVAAMGALMLFVLTAIAGVAAYVAFAERSRRAQDEARSAIEEGRRAREEGKKLEQQYREKQLLWQRAATLNKEIAKIKESASSQGKESDAAATAEKSIELSIIYDTLGRGEKTLEILENLQENVENASLAKDRPELVLKVLNLYAEELREQKRDGDAEEVEERIKTFREGRQKPQTPEKPDGR